MKFTKVVLSIILILSTQIVFAQKGKTKKAASVLYTYQKSKDSNDLNRALELIEEAAVDDELKNDVWTTYYQALIYKKVYAKNDSKKSELIVKSLKNLNKVLTSEQKFTDKKDALYYLKLSIYDAYNEGLIQYNLAEYENAYLLYKSLIDAKDILEKNNSDLTLKDAEGKDVKLNDADIWNNYAVFCIQNKKNNEAFKALENLVKLNPSATTYSQLIQMAEELNKNDKKEKYTLEAMNQYPNDINVLISGVNYFIGKKDLTQATQLLETAIKNNPNRADLYVVYGQNLDALKRYDDAEKAYLDGLKLDPENFQLNYNMGSIFFNKGLALLQGVENPNSENFLPFFKKSKEFFEKSMKNATDKIAVEKVIKNVDDIINGKN